MINMSNDVLGLCKRQSHSFTSFCRTAATRASLLSSSLSSVSNSSWSLAARLHFGMRPVHISHAVLLRDVHQWTSGDEMCESKRGVARSCRQAR